LIGENHADEEVQEAHDRKRGESGLLDLLDEGGPGKLAGGPDDCFEHFDRHAAEIAQQLIALMQDCQRSPPHAFEKFRWAAMPLARWGGFGVVAFDALEQGTIALRYLNGADLHATFGDLSFRPQE